MKILDLLKAAGTSLLKEVPLGGVIVDVAELILDEKLDRDQVTGAELIQKVEALSPEAKAKFLNKQLDTKLSEFTTWVELQKELNGESTASKSRAMIAMMIAALLVLLTFSFGALMMHQYFTVGRAPSVEELLIVFGVPSLALLSFFGIRVGPLQELVVAVLLKRMAKYR